jgi:hypothetical protein
MTVSHARQDVSEPAKGLEVVELCTRPPPENLPVRTDRSNREVTVREMDAFRLIASSSLMTEHRGSALWAVVGKMRGARDRMSVHGSTFRTWPVWLTMSVLRAKADFATARVDVWN